MVSVMKTLVPIPNHEYLIITNKSKLNEKKYTGKCMGDYPGRNEWLFWHVSRVKSPYDVKSGRIFSIHDEFYDLTQMKKVLDDAQHARQSMEKRALKQILNRLINETFEW